MFGSVAVVVLQLQAYCLRYILFDQTSLCVSILFLSHHSFLGITVILDLIHRKTRSFYLFTWRKYCPLGIINFLNIDTFKIIVSFVVNVTVLMRVT